MEGKEIVFWHYTLCILCGVFLCASAGISGFSLLVPVRISGMLCLLLLVGSLFVKHRVVRVCILAALVCLVAAYRYSVFMQHTDGDIRQLHTETHTIMAILSTEPDIRADGVRYIATALLNTATGEPLDGRMYLKSGLYPRYTYGDILEIRCRFVAPEPIEEFRYDRYLARYKVFTLCVHPSITYHSASSPHMVLSGIFLLKRWVKMQIDTLWHEPYAGFMAGLLYGYRGGLGSLNELFQRTGVTHIIAISGYNITVISTLCLAILLRIGCTRKQAFFLVVAAITLFVLFAGASASVVRAGIMGSIVLTATRIGRAQRILPVLLLSAASMVLYNPLILLFDAGFQLSFLSTIGLVYLSPLLGTAPRWMPPWLFESYSATMAATMATLPLILLQFERLSIVSVPVNMLILWAIPYAMAWGFVSVLVQGFSTALGQMLALIPYAFMRYIVEVVSLVSSVPFASIPLRVSPLGACALYGLLFGWYRKKQTHRQKAGVFGSVSRD